MTFFNRKKDKISEKMEEMKASTMAEEVIKNTKKLIHDFGDRISGSVNTRKIADKLKESFEETCDTAEIEEFQLNKKVKRIWKRILPFSYLTLLLFFASGITFIGIVLVCLFLAFGVWCYFFLKDNPLNVKHDTDGTNVYGVVEPEGESEKTIIFSAHHDSAEVSLLKPGELEKYGVVYLISFITIIILSLIPMSLAVRIICSVVMICPFYFIRNLGNADVKEYSPGAGDNLVSSSILLSLSKYFNRNRLENTRIIMVSFDCEEEGLFGSKAFYKNHSFDKKTTSVINMDCLYKADKLCFLTSDCNSVQKLDAGLANKCVHIVRNMGYKAKARNIPLFAGATDACSAARKGLSATTVTAVSWRDNVCHTAEDTVDQIDIKVIEEVISMCIKFGEEEIKKKKEEKKKDEKTKLKYHFSGITKK